MGNWTDAAIRQRKVYDKAASYLTDEQALTVKGVYREWENLVKAGETVNKGCRFRYGGKLWRTEQPTYTFVDTYVPGSAGTESIFSMVDESHAGTLEDPIPFEKNMEIHEGLYYSQHEVVYRCIRNSGQPLQHDLSSLVGNYVEVIA